VSQKDMLGNCCVHPEPAVASYAALSVTRLIWFGQTREPSQPVNKGTAIDWPAHKQYLCTRVSTESSPAGIVTERGVHCPRLGFVGQAQKPEGQGVGVVSFGPLGQANWSQMVRPV
jgi:hypothetical protein